MAKPLVPDDAWKPGPRAEELGEIEIPSGVLAVCDAGTLLSPVEIAVPAASHRVRVARAEGSSDNFAMALVAEGAWPVRWEPAGSYGVDAGMSGFIDAELLARLAEHPFRISIYDDLISNHLDPAEDEGHAGALVPFERSRFAACRSGAGDGVYPVFVGRDARGVVVAVVTIFA